MKKEYRIEIISKGALGINKDPEKVIFLIYLKTKKPPDLGGFNIFNSENYSNKVNGLSK